MKRLVGEYTDYMSADQKKYLSVMVSIKEMFEMDTQIQAYCIVESDNQVISTVPVLIDMPKNPADIEENILKTFKINMLAEQLQLEST